MSKSEQKQDDTWNADMPQHYEDPKYNELSEKCRILALYETANMRVDELRSFVYEQKCDQLYDVSDQQVKKYWNEFFGNHSVEEIEQLEGELFDAFYKNKLDPRNRPSRNLNLFTNFYNQSFSKQIQIYNKGAKDE